MNDSKLISWQACRGLFLLIMLSLAVLTNGCDGLWPLALRRSHAQQETGVLRVGLLRHSLSGQTSLGLGGLEQEILQKTAHDQNLKIRFQHFNSASGLLFALQNHKLDLIGSRFDLEIASGQKILASPSYEDVPLSVVCAKNSNAVSDPSPLPFWQSLARTLGRSGPPPPADRTFLYLRSQLSEKSLLQLEELWPGREWQAYQPKTSSSILSPIVSDPSRCVVLDRTLALAELRSYNSLEIVAETPWKVSIGFLLGSEHTGAQVAISNWLSHAIPNHDLQNIRELYEGHWTALDSLDTAVFFRRVQERLPELRPTFESVAAEFNLPWQLVAAVAYQESHWESSAESFTGVKGLMMLTKGTASDLGVEDRCDTEQSVWGGVKYLRQLINAQPKSLSSRERLAFALASYNVGIAHILDVQVLARSSGRNPWSWPAVKHLLPLLSYPEYYQQLEYGQARGQEPVDFTNRVLGFAELLD